MAYISQDTKKKINAALKVALKDYDIKVGLSIDNHSTLVVWIKSGSIDFLGNQLEVAKNWPSGDRDNRVYYAEHNVKNGYMTVNPYWFQEHFSGVAKDVLDVIMKTAKEVGEWYDKSDIMSDYFNTAFYINLQVGRYDKPYELVN